MVFKNWIRVLTEPKQVFAEEKANASLGKALKIMFIAGIISGIFMIIAAYIYISLFYGGQTPLSLNLELSFLLFIAIIVLIPVGFLISSGIIYVFAKLLKGIGNFTTQTYLIALFDAPCMVITSALYIIPFLGWVLGFLASIYALYLLTLALRETHQYSTGKAILTWIIPYVVMFVITFMITISGLILA